MLRTGERAPARWPRLTRRGRRRRAALDSGLDTHLDELEHEAGVREQL